MRPERTDASPDEDGSALSEVVDAAPESYYDC